jgi:transposase
LSGGRLALELKRHGLPVVMVNPRQVRDCTRARGCLAKADRIDAMILASFGRCIRPEVRPLKDEETRAMEALLNRRRQLVNTKAQEMLRHGTAASEWVQKDVQDSIAWLEKRIARIDAELEQKLRASEVWREKEKRLREVPGVGPVTAKTLLLRCMELGRIDRAQDRGAGGSGAARPRQRQASWQALHPGRMCGRCCTWRRSRPSIATRSSRPLPNV